MPSHSSQPPAIALDCPAGQRAYTHAAGEVCIPEDPQRIVSLHDIGITLPLVELGIEPVGSHGRVGEGDEPYIRTVRDIFDVDFSNSDIEFIGVFNQIDLEVVAELDPDLILLRPYEAELQDPLSSIAPAVQLDIDALGFLGTYEALADITGSTVAYEALRRRYDTALTQLQGAYDHWDDLTISMVIPHNGFTAMPTFGAFSQVMSDLGISVPESFGELGDDAIQLSVEQLPELDADFMMLSYVPGRADQGTPQHLREEMEALVPNWCNFLHACRNNQVLYLPREEIYSRSFVSLETSIDFIAAGVIGRDFVPLED